MKGKYMKQRMVLKRREGILLFRCSCLWYLNPILSWEYLLLGIKRKFLFFFMSWITYYKKVTSRFKHRSRYFRLRKSYYKKGTPQYLLQMWCSFQLVLQFLGPLVYNDLYNNNPFLSTPVIVSLLFLHFPYPTKCY